MSTIKDLGPVQALISASTVPISISFVALNGLPKFDLDIVVSLVKLYKTSSKDRLIPLFLESSKRDRRLKCGLFPILGFKTFAGKVAPLTRVLERSNY
jgi:hypothetical protein